MKNRKKLIKIKAKKALCLALTFATVVTNGCFGNIGNKTFGNVKKAKAAHNSLEFHPNGNISTSNAVRRIANQGEDSTKLESDSNGYTRYPNTKYYFGKNNNAFMEDKNNNNSSVMALIDTDAKIGTKDIASSWNGISYKDGFPDPETYKYSNGYYNCKKLLEDGFLSGQHIFDYTNSLTDLFFDDIDKQFIKTKNVSVQTSVSASNNLETINKIKQDYPVSGNISNAYLYLPDYAPSDTYQFLIDDQNKFGNSFTNNVNYDFIDGDNFYFEIRLGHYSDNNYGCYSNSDEYGIHDGLSYSLLLNDGLYRSSDTAYNSIYPETQIDLSKVLMKKNVSENSASTKDLYDFPKNTASSKRKFAMIAGKTKSNFNVSAINGKNISDIVAGRTYKFNYTGASTSTLRSGGKNYVSCILYKAETVSNGTVLNPVYYENLSEITSVSGTVEITIPTNLNKNQTYVMALFEEEKNNGETTDYTSEPIMSSFSLTDSCETTGKHIYNSDPSIIQQKSCTKDEITRYQCDFFCGSYEDRVSAKATGHTYEVTEPATITHGTKSVCKTCGDVKVADDILPSYSITYNYGGNKKIGYATTETATIQDPKALTGGIPVSKDHHHYNGWIDSKGTLYNIGDTIKLDADINLELAINWIKNPYTIKFNANGGSGTMEDTVFKSDKNEKIPANKFTQHGKKFVGWNTESDGSGTLYADKATVNNAANPDESITLYAQWTDDTYSIRYDGNSGSGRMSDETVKVNDKINLMTNAYKKQGYVFVGWNTKADGSGMSYTDEQEIQGLGSNNETITLYAQWKLDDNTPYIVKHFKQRISDDTYDEPEIEKFKGTTDSEIKPSVKEYKGFVSPEVQTSTIKADGTTVISYYYNRNKYNISFDANGGTGLMKTLESVKYGETKKLTENSFTKKGYKFTGWNTKIDGTGTAYSNKQEIENLSEKNNDKITLYAQWIKAVDSSSEVIGKNDNLKDDYISLDVSKKYLMTEDDIISAESSDKNVAYVNDAGELIIGKDGTADITYTTGKGTFKYHIVVKNGKIYLTLYENSKALDSELKNWSDKTTDTSGAISDKKDIKNDYIVLEPTKLYKITKDTILKSDSTNKDVAYINKDGNLVLSDKDGTADITYTTGKGTFKYHIVVKNGKVYLTLYENSKTLDNELKNWSDKTTDTSGAITDKTEVKEKYTILDTSKIYEVTKDTIIKSDSTNKDVAYINKEGKLVLGNKDGSTYLTYVTDKGIFRYYIVVKDGKAYFTVEDNAKILDSEINPISTVGPATPPAISTSPAISTGPAISTTPAITATPKPTPETRLKGTEFFGGRYSSFVSGNYAIFDINNEEIVSKQDGITTVTVVMADGRKFEYEVIMKNGKIQTYSKKEIVDNAVQITTGKGLFGEDYVSYKSSDEDIFNLDANGNIVSKKDGTVMIDVTKKDGTIWVFGVTIKNGKILSYTSQLVSEPESDKKTAKDLFGSDYKSYISSDTKVFSIDENGNIVSKVNGLSVVTVTMKDGSKWSYVVTMKDGKVLSYNKKLISKATNNNKNKTKKTTVIVNGIRYKIVGSKVKAEKVTNKKKSSFTIQKSVKINGKTYKVTEINKNLFKNNKKLKKITIKAASVNIKAGTFKNCKKLTSVKLQKIKTLKIAKNAFKGCKKLKFKVSGNKTTRQKFKKVIKKAKVSKFSIS